MVAVQEPFLCPTCGTIIAVTDRRCSYCLSLVSRESQANREHAPSQRTSRTRGVPRLRPSVLAAFVAMIAMAGWCGYDRLTEDFRPLPLAVAGTVSAPAAGPEWASVGGDLGATRRTSASPVMGVEAAWSVDLETGVQTPSVSGAGHLFLTLADDRLVALDLGDGSIVWTYQGPHRLWSAPVVADGTAYLTLSSGDVIAFDAASGERRWTTSVGSGLFSSPTVADGMVIVVAADQLYGLEAATGELRWNRPRDVPVLEHAPVILDDYIVLISHRGTFVYDRHTGAESYFYPHNSPVGMAAEGLAIFTVSSRLVSAIDARSGAPWWEPIRGPWTRLWVWRGAPRPPAPPALWQLHDDGNRRREVFPPVLGDELLIIADGSGHVRAIDRGSGALEWEVQAGLLGGPPTLTAEGLLLVGQNFLALLDSSTGSETSRMPLPFIENRQVVVAGDAIYVIDGAGVITAFRP